jgi:hypothetical protein
MICLRFLIRYMIFYGVFWIGWWFNRCRSTHLMPRLHIPYTRFFWSMWRFKVAGKCLHTCAWYCSDTYENHIWILRPAFSTMVHIVPTLRTCSALGAFLCFAAIGRVTWSFATLEPWGHCTEFVGVLYKPTPMSKISRLTMTVIRTAGGGYECCFAWLGWTYVFHIASDWSCTVKSPVRC